MSVAPQPTPEEREEHRRRQVWQLSHGSCEAYQRFDMPALSTYLTSLTKVQQA